MLPSDTVWARTTRRRATVIATTSHFPIASLDAGRTRGRIGMSFCPGRALQSSLGRVYSRDLAHDLGTIARWETRVVVTLMEEVELFELGLHALPGQLRSLGITWHLVPLAEGSVPDRSFEWRWAAILPGLAAVLVQKGRVLIHCKDGLRRTGFVAARLLVELGCRPEDAINRVRAARPGAIGTVEQERYVLEARRSHDLFEKG